MSGRFTDDMVEAAAKAMDDAEFGFSLNLTRLVDGVSTYTLTYSDGSPTLEFEDTDEAYEHVAQRKRLIQARAALAAALQHQSSPPVEAEGWQTIDTAPKDGTAIIGSSDDDTAFICAWVADDAEGNGDWLEYGSDVVNPRRWIPVPSGKAMIRAFVAAAPSTGGRR